jgi:hypothetical protein
MNMSTQLRVSILAAPLLALLSACAPAATEPELGTSADDIGGVAVDGDAACSFTQGGWGSACNGQNVGCLRDAWFPTVFPDGMTVGTSLPHFLATSADMEAYLPQGGPAWQGVYSTFYGQMTALELNLSFSAAGAFGASGGLGHAKLVGGAYDGWTATQLLAHAESTSPALVTGGLVAALTAFNEGFHTCDPGDFPPPDPDPEPDPDGDGDGVPTSHDCDDGNALIGALLYENDMSSDTAYLRTGPELTDPWVYGGGVVSNTEGGQQALLGQPESWENTVTFLSLSAHGSKSGCSSDAADCDPERFRAGVLARASVDADQDEGYHGYRCAIAMNAATDCYEPGPFVQLAAFLDAEEDEIQSECVDGCAPNPSFDQLDRENRSAQTDLLGGDSALLTFWAVGAQLVCTFDGVNGEHVVTSAMTEHFSSGGTGLSTLNALGDFDHLKVCEAFGAP